MKFRRLFQAAQETGLDSEISEILSSVVSPCYQARWIKGVAAVILTQTMVCVTIDDAFVLSHSKCLLLWLCVILVCICVCICLCACNRGVGWSEVGSMKLSSLRVSYNQRMHD